MKRVLMSTETSKPAMTTRCDKEKDKSVRGLRTRDKEEHASSDVKGPGLYYV